MAKSLCFLIATCDEDERHFQADFGLVHLGA